MPQLSLPIGIFLSPFAERISQHFFLETLQNSNNHYLDWLTKREWISVTDEIHVSIYSPNILSNEKTSMAQISIKTKSKTTIPKLDLYVEASNAAAKYQDTIVAYNIGPKITIVSLPSIPLRTFLFPDNGSLFPTLDTISITCISQNDRLSNTSPTIINPSSVELLNDRFIKKWGYFWNMRAIDRKYNEISSTIRHYLFSPRKIYGHTSKITLRDRINTISRVLLGGPLYWLLTRQLLIKIYFWLPILLKIKKFNA